jgi:5'(3')-deoxyribonucleotidase
MANFYPPGLENERKNLAIDFDGVIHNADKGWGDGTCYGEPLPGAIDAIKRLSENYTIVIFTAKAKTDRPLVNGKTGAMLVLEWLEKHNISQYVSKITAEKPRAEIYIDDNGYRFENWVDTLNFIKSYEQL